MSGRPGCCANVVAFQFPVGRSAVPARCFTLAVLTLYERVRFIVTVDIGGLREADGQFTHRLVWHVAPVLCALFPFLFRHVLVSVGVVPVGEVVTPVLRVEGFRVRGVFGEYLEYDSVVVGSAHDDRVVENIYWGERATCTLFEFAHALVERVDFIEIAALVNVGNVRGEDALVVGGKVREERFVPCGVDVFL